MRRPLLPDAVLVAVLLAVVPIDVLVVNADDMRGPAVANVAWILASVVPLLWRRRAPIAVFAVVVATVELGGVALYGWEFQTLVEPWFALLVAVYTVAAYEDGRRAAIALVAGGALVLANDVAAHATGQPPGDVWPSWLFYAMVGALGRGMYRRQRLTAALEERTVQLEHEREQKARMAIIEERARIARELHDVIAHTVSVIVVQASVERRDLGDERPQTQKTLADIEHAGRESLVELRRLLGVLRRTDDVPALAPQPGLDALDGLVDQVRDAGLGVDVRVEGEPVKLPAGLDLAAFRVVQEALTNTLKHAHANRAEVTVRYRGRELALDVVDDGDGDGAAARNGSGHGLVGMRERTELYGGEVRAGRRPGGGFAVHARFPLEPAAR